MPFGGLDAAPVSPMRLSAGIDLVEITAIFHGHRFPPECHE
ncbi:hypothetical protein [Microlunatus sp. Gsoil 973]|nr:hypothetical protein [Microlunatus sp. Gsoil 973]